MPLHACIRKQAEHYNKSPTAAPVPALVGVLLAIVLLAISHPVAATALLAVTPPVA